MSNKERWKYLELKLNREVIEIQGKPYARYKIGYRQGKPWQLESEKE